MKDRYGRAINYLRVSVTDRCNLRCHYCMPKEGVVFLNRESILSFDEIDDVVRTAVGLGVTKVRLTGGEPLVRRGISTLVSMVRNIPGVRDLGMTTNGQLLAEHAEGLAEAGLDRVNVSLDTMDPDRYREITRGGDITHVLSGIEAAREAGLTPIKLNCVVSESSAEPDAQAVARFGHAEDFEVRFIRRMSFADGSFSVVEGGAGGDCPRCNRMRLSSDGLLRPCLFSDLGFSVREYGPEKAFRMAVCYKPEAGEPCSHNWISGIGG